MFHYIAIQFLVALRFDPLQRDYAHKRAEELNAHLCNISKPRTPGRAVQYNGELEIARKWSIG
jgi:hypothetical protein